MFNTRKKCPEDGKQCLSCKTRGQDCIWPQGSPKIKSTTHQTKAHRSKTNVHGITSSTRAKGTKDDDTQEAMDDIGHLNANVIVPSHQ